MDADRIGCSLAEAAESPAYEAYLEEASHVPKSLHVRLRGGKGPWLCTCGVLGCGWVGWGGERRGGGCSRGVLGTFRGAMWPNSLHVH